MGPEGFPALEGETGCFLVVPSSPSAALGPVTVRVSAYGVQCVSRHSPSAQWSDGGCTVSPGTPKERSWGCLSAGRRAGAGVGGSLRPPCPSLPPPTLPLALILPAHLPRASFPLRTQGSRGAQGLLVFSLGQGVFWAPPPATLLRALSLACLPEPLAHLGCLPTEPPLRWPQGQFGALLRRRCCGGTERASLLPSPLQVGQQSSLALGHCLCSHLSFFGSSFWVVPVQVDVVRTAEYFGRVTQNPVLALLLGALYALYALGVAWARWQDVRDRPQVSSWGGPGPSGGLPAVCREGTSCQASTGGD